MHEEFPVYRQAAISAALCRIKLQLCDGQHADALAEIAPVERWARQHGHGRLLVTLAILAARALDLSGAARAASARFDEAVGMSMFQGVIGPFLECRRFLVLNASEEETEAAGGEDTDRYRDKFLRRLRRLLRSTAARPGESTILSDPELLTLRHLDKGYTNKEIARLLKVSPNTVKYRLKSLFAKMGVDSRREAVQISREQGLLAAPIATAHGGPGD
jgi:LuxR family maltose regulon positive regulatory protein